MIWKCLYTFELVFGLINFVGDFLGDVAVQIIPFLQLMVI